MAKMIPAVELDQIEHASEVPVYATLREQLGADYTVLHSYPWLRPWRGEGALLEGEIDFVVVHPERGILVLEVKGGRDIRYERRRWVRYSSKGPKEFQDPFEQARKNMHALLEIIEERSGGQIKKEQLNYGYAVVFPEVDYEDDPPPHADNAIVISRRHLPAMAHAIQTAYERWTAAPRSLSRAAYSVMLQDCVMPVFRLFRPVGPDVAEDTEKLLELTEQQAQVFEGLYAQDRVLIEGVAGSGKTFLALHRALAFARCGRRTLLACYNRELAAWLKRQVDEDPSVAPHRALITIQNFHALAADLAKEAALDFKPLQGGALSQAFWDEEVPELLEQAALGLELRGDAVRYDALVVDEAQDFSLGWWYALTQSLLSTPSAPIYAFMDPNQSLRGEVESPPVDFDARFRLTKNCRNTRKIATASASVLELDAHTFTRAPLGAPPRLIRASSDRQQKGLVSNELSKLLSREELSPHQIAVIGPASKERGSLASLKEIEGVALVTDAGQWREGKGILVTTARSFKGLEADIVVLYDLGKFGQHFRREDLYVACTRAKVLLIAIAHGKECREAVIAAFAAAEGES